MFRLAFISVFFSFARHIHNNLRRIEHNLSRDLRYFCTLKSNRKRKKE